MQTIIQICRCSNLMMDEVEIRLEVDLRTNELFIGVYNCEVVMEMLSVSPDNACLYLDYDLEGFYER